MKVKKSTELINAIVENDTIKTSEIFNALLMSRIVEMLNSKRIDIASTMFTEAVYVVSHTGHSNPVGDYSIFPQREKPYVNHITQYPQIANDTKKLLIRKGFNNVQIHKNGKLFNADNATGKLKESIELDEAAKIKETPLFPNGIVEGVIHHLNKEGKDLTDIVHNVMTPEEYKALNKKKIGTHEVFHNVDGFGGIGIKYTNESEHNSGDRIIKKFISRHGFTTIEGNKNHVTISHTGNMGNTEENVKHNVDKILGNGHFDKLKPHGEFYKDKDGNIHDSPSYSYMLQIPRKKFDEIHSGVKTS